MKKSPLLCAIGGLMMIASANAQMLLVDHYNMNGSGADSVNAANSGTLNGNATFSNGRLVTPGTDQTSYLGLPATVGSGLTGNFSIEDYTSTTNSGTSYSTLFSFASSQTNFILFNANRPGVNMTTADFEQTPATGNNVEINIGSTGVAALSDNAEHQIVLTYTFATGAIALYNNGSLFASGNIGAGFSFATAAAGGDDGINGHAPFGDPTYAGSTDDFRLYSGALTAAEVASLDASGPNATDAQITADIPEPATWVAMLAGLGAVLGWQRFRRTLG